MSMNNNDPSGRSFQRYCVTGMCNESDKLPFLMGYGAGLSSRDELLREAEKFIGELIELEPEYHSQGMGCGLEDRDITDRYDAMAHGWEKCVERYAELIENPDLIAKLQTALKEAME